MVLWAITYKQSLHDIIANIICNKVEQKYNQNWYKLGFNINKIETWETIQNSNNRNLYPYLYNK